MEYVLNNTDLRKYIWSFLRIKPKIQCSICKTVCIWDKQVKYFIKYDQYNYCIDCWILENDINCNIC